MDDPDDINMIEDYYYSNTTGKRAPEELGLAPRMDPDGDNVTEEADIGFVYRPDGPKGAPSLAPLANNVLAVTKSLVIILALSVFALGAWYGTFGCRSLYAMLEPNTVWLTQLVLLLAIFINVFLVRADASYGWGLLGASPYPVSTTMCFVGAVVAWLLINIMAKLGESWLWYNVPFWPGPMTWWGFEAFLMVFLFIIDDQRTYWAGKGNNIAGSLERKYQDFWRNLEVNGILVFFVVIIWGFVVEWVDEKRSLGDKFSFIQFLFGVGLQNKTRVDRGAGRRGRCRDKEMARLAKEVADGIKTSNWTRMTNFVKQYWKKL